jgi:hypothetical protein
MWRAERVRRFLFLPLAGVLTLVAASSALAAPPTHETVVSPPLEFAAGEMCSFAILLETTTENSKGSTFAVAPDGGQRVVTRGVATNTATNLDTGESITRVGGYRISVLFAADGSVEADGTGALYAYYFSGDPSELGAGLHAVNGHVHESYGADGTFLGATFDGSSYDLCEVLA